MKKVVSLLIITVCTMSALCITQKSFALGAVGFFSAEVKTDIPTAASETPIDSVTDTPKKTIKRASKKVIKKTDTTTEVKEDREEKALPPKTTIKVDSTKAAAKSQDTIQNKAIRDAIKSNDYMAFVTARNADQPTVPTQEQFAKKVEDAKIMKTLNAAMDAGDLAAFNAALALLATNGLSKELTQTQFNMLVANRKLKKDERTEKQKAINATIDANDYNAFVTARTANQPSLPTQTEFEKMVAQAKEKSTSISEDSDPVEKMIIRRKVKTNESS